LNKRRAGGEKKKIQRPKEWEEKVQATKGRKGPKNTAGPGGRCWAFGTPETRVTNTADMVGEGSSKKIGEGGK